MRPQSLGNSECWGSAAWRGSRQAPPSAARPPLAPGPHGSHFCFRPSPGVCAAWRGWLLRTPGQPSAGAVPTSRTRLSRSLWVRLTDTTCTPAACSALTVLRPMPAGSTLSAGAPPRPSHTRAAGPPLPAPVTSARRPASRSSMATTLDAAAALAGSQMSRRRKVAGIWGRGGSRGGDGVFSNCQVETRPVHWV